MSDVEPSSPHHNHQPQGNTENGWHTLPKYYPNAANFNNASDASSPVPGRKNRSRRSPGSQSHRPMSPGCHSQDVIPEGHHELSPIETGIHRPTPQHATYSPPPDQPYTMENQFPHLTQPYPNDPYPYTPQLSSPGYPIHLPSYMDNSAAAANSPPPPPPETSTPRNRHSPYKRHSGANHVSPPVVPPPRSPIAPAHGHLGSSPRAVLDSSGPDGGGRGGEGGGGGRRKHRHRPRKPAHPPPVTESAQAAQNLLAYCDELLADLEKVAKS